MENADPLHQAVLWAQILFYIVTAIGLLAAGIFGLVKYRLYRANRPFINISLNASSRPCSPEHIQIGVTASLYNGSRVLAKVDSLEWECRAIAQYNSEDVDEKIVEYFSESDGLAREESSSSEFPWNVQQRIRKTDLKIEVEPNESSHENATFIVPSYCAAVQIRLFMETMKDNTRGWTAVIYHDTTHLTGEE